MESRHLDEESAENEEDDQSKQQEELYRDEEDEEDELTENGSKVNSVGGRQANSSSSFRAYYNSSNAASSPLVNIKKIIHRHYHNHPSSTSSLQSIAQNKSQSANNLLSFSTKTLDGHRAAESSMSMTSTTVSTSAKPKDTPLPAFAAAVSEPSVVVANEPMNSTEVKYSSGISDCSAVKNVSGSSVTQNSVAGASSSSSSAYFPLEPTMEECLESLDISYDTTNSLNDLAVGGLLHNIANNLNTGSSKSIN